MGQSQSAKFDKLFLLICTKNTEEFSRHIHSCSSPAQAADLCSLSDTAKASTLLMHAAFYGNLTICRLLIDSGAQLLVQDIEGHNALYYAISGKSNDVAKYLIETALTLFNNEIQMNFVNNTDNTGETCLHEAVKINFLPCIQLLLKHNIDVNIVNKDGITALHRAVDLGHPDIVRLLLKNKAELNTKDANGWTPLHVASAHNDMELVRLLLNRGARPNVTDNQGHTPLKWARETGSQDVFAYLKSIGGKEYDSTTERSSRRSSKKQNNAITIPEILNDNDIINKEINF